MAAAIDPADPATVGTQYWHPLDDGRVQCDVCPRACKLREGQRGVCFVRGRVDDQVVLTSYGRSSGWAVDPIEKKPLYHFLPGTPVLSFGTAGCNLACRFCQNWDITKSKEIDTLGGRAGPEAIARSAVDLGCDSVAFTYNDPTVFLEYARDTAVACHELGVRTVAVTAGYIEPGPRRDLYPHLDAVNVDLKAFSESFYRRVAMGRLAPVLESIEFLCAETDAWVELTTLLIPGHNDGDEELDRLTSWVVEHLGPHVPLHFSAFHPDFRMTDVEATPIDTLRRARSIAMSNGIHHVYLGNVHDLDGDTTRCAACGERLIERDWYELRSYRLTDTGACPDCLEPLPGRFGPTAGSWGARSVPVRIAEPLG